MHLGLLLGYILHTVCSSPDAHSVIDCTIKSRVSITEYLFYHFLKLLAVCGIEGNIDQVQYCDKIKNIVDFLGTHLSDEELMKIWKMQVCEMCAIYEPAVDAETRHLHFTDWDMHRLNAE